MKIGDLALFYHKKKIFGTMVVASEPYQDSTTESSWLSINFIPEKTFETPIALDEIKADKFLNDTNIIRQARITVIKLSEMEYSAIINLRAN